MQAEDAREKDGHVNRRAPAQRAPVGKPGKPRADDQQRKQDMRDIVQMLYRSRENVGQPVLSDLVKGRSFDKDGVGQPVGALRAGIGPVEPYQKEGGQSKRRRMAGSASYEQ